MCFVFVKLCFFKNLKDMTVANKDITSTPITDVIIFLVLKTPIADSFTTFIDFVKFNKRVSTYRKVKTVMVLLGLGFVFIIKTIVSGKVNKLFKVADFCLFII